MAKTVADSADRAFDRLGRRHDFRLSRRRRERHFRSAAHITRTRCASSRSGMRKPPPSRRAATRNTRAPWRLSRDVRPRRHPPAEWPVRREVRRSAGARDYRSHLSRSDRHPLPAGRRSRQAVHGCRRLQPAGDGPRARRTTSSTRRSRPRLPTARVAHITIPKDIQDWTRRDDAALEAERHGAQLGSSAGAFIRCRPQAVAAGARPRSSIDGSKVAILAGRGCLGAREEVLRSWPRSPARRSSRRCSARPSFPTGSPYTTGGIGLLGHGALAGRAAGMRHADHRRHRASRTWSSIRSPARRRPFRSTSPRRASVCGILPTSAWSATAPLCSRALLPLLEPKADRAFLNKAQERMAAWNRSCRSAAPARTCR